LTFKDDKTGEHIPFINKELHSDDLYELASLSFDKCGNSRTVQFLDNLKTLGFHYATISGLSVALTDLVAPGNKDELIREAADEVHKVEEDYRAGTITDGERYNKVIGIWSNLTKAVEDALFLELENAEVDGYAGFNPVHIMADSGARSKKQPILQIAGMRGLMTKPSGEIIEQPIFTSFREGLSVLEYFISTHGARKGLADTAIKTASSGYLTRKLVDVAQDVIIRADNCGTTNGIVKTSLMEEESSLSDKIHGRVAAEDVIHPRTGKTLIETGELITKEIAEEIDDASIPVVKIRSVLTCETSHGVCRKCYGTDLSTGKLVDIGEAIGIIAAQSIGEPGTQLTMRTFHTGGALSGAVEQSEAVAKHDGIIKYHDVEYAIAARRQAAGSIEEEEDDKKMIVLSRNGQISIHDEDEYELERHDIPIGSVLHVSDGSSVKKDDKLLEWDPHHVPILTQVAGKVRFADIIENVTMREDIDEVSRQRERVIIEYKGENLLARIEIVGEAALSPADDGRVVQYHMPTGAHLLVSDGDTVAIGDMLARIPSEILKAKDIVTGLPRVTELFEARRPKDSAIIAEIDGEVKFEGISRGMRVIRIVNPETGMESEAYRIPIGKHVIVQEGHEVTAGERLTEGSIAPEDILGIKGETEVQSHLVRGVQEVYRDKERINDKHIEVIVRQMMRKVRIEDKGETEFLEGDEVDKAVFQRENNRVIAKGGKPATAQPILQGISKAALTTESFISAASFQQTTNVLTKASVQGKRDTLRGLKENVIMGHLIPAGTGVPQMRKIKILQKPKTPGLSEKRTETEGAITDGSNE